MKLEALIICGFSNSDCFEDHFYYKMNILPAVLHIFSSNNLCRVSTNRVDSF